jgi:hypothetical protein
MKSPRVRSRNALAVGPDRVILAGRCLQTWVATLVKCLLRERATLVYSRTVGRTTLAKCQTRLEILAECLPADMVTPTVLVGSRRDERVTLGKCLQTRLVILEGSLLASHPLMDSLGSRVEGRGRRAEKVTLAKRLQAKLATLLECQIILADRVGRRMLDRVTLPGLPQIRLATLVEYVPALGNRVTLAECLQIRVAILAECPLAEMGILTELVGSRRAERVIESIRWLQTESADPHHHVHYNAAQAVRLRRSRIGRLSKSVVSFLCLSQTPPKRFLTQLFTMSLLARSQTLPVLRRRMSVS